MAYIDTSVLVAFYYPEPLSPTAQRVIEEPEGPVISPLTHLELCSALALKIRIGEMPKEDARRILSAFRHHLGQGMYRLVPIEAREYEMACDWIASFSAPLRAADVLHLACAFTSGLALVTADQRLAAAAKRFGVKCRTIA